MLKFSKSEVTEFWRKWHDGSIYHPALRVGQAFYNYFHCQRVKGNPLDVSRLDRLHSLDGKAAVKLIEELTDEAQ